MWIIGGAVIVVVVLLPKILELLIGSQRPESKDTDSDNEWGSG